MNTLVTGGSGLVGSCITGTHKPRSSDVNLLDFDSVLSYVKDNDIRQIIHCAARVGGVKENIEKPGEFFYENTQMTLNILEAARICNVEKVVCVLSTCIFPAEATYPITTDQIHLGEPHKSNYGYGYAKRMTEVNARAYRDQYGMNVVTVVPCNVYGIGDNFDVSSSHVIPGLIHKYYLASRDDTDVTIWGGGLAKREFIYNKDLGRIIDWVVENYNDTEPLIISPDEEISIASLSNKIASIFKFFNTILYDNSMPDGMMRKPSDNTKLKSLLPDFSYTSIRDGLEETIQWFTDNYDKGNVRL